MTIDVNEWALAQVSDLIVSRLETINEGDGWNTTPYVTERWHWPEEVAQEQLPLVMVIEDRTEQEEGAIQGSVSRGKIRLRHFWYIWGVVASEYSVRQARMELLADVKSVLFQDESFVSPDGTQQYALDLAIENIDYDSNALQDLQKGFFVLELSARVDILRKE